MKTDFSHALKVKPVIIGSRTYHVTGDFPMRTYNKIKQCFRIDSTLLDAIDEEAASDTVKDMRELGIFKPPYDDFKVQLVNAKGFMFDIDYHYFPDGVKGENEGETFESVISVYDSNGKFMEPAEYASNLATLLPQFVGLLYQDLLVLLATKGIEKKVTHNKLAKFGVGKAKTEYTTTLSIARPITIYEKGEPTGQKKIPHIRRGHIRNQPYGPSNQFHKKVFVPPCVIHAEEYFVNHREAYNVIKGVT